MMNKTKQNIEDCNIQPDYTIKDLAALTQRNAHEISMVAERFYGHYKNGRQHMFFREEIDFRRKMGMNLQKTR